MNRKPTIFTIGHSNLPLWSFRLKLLQNNIQLVVDVRTVPRSRFCPHFNKNALQRALADKHIDYIWRGKNLGGKGINQNYQQNLQEIARMAKEGLRISLLCSEGDYLKCHRYTVLTPSFIERGLKVQHILKEIRRG